ncbi:hypothetical protein GALMADRAFT_239469 [Galerina marginata CBS 339.88]|uniref:JmjC domain-containing protein n=1 Tax=Galerina marginata (strain CBS 339.88) TaxID=685588 RepID=A0A067TNN3_GALM3|nr:hypothetical protein GALMADRAFT_239469 [Galerina marginata CBS 339.88]
MQWDRLVAYSLAEELMTFQYPEALAHHGSVVYNAALNLAEGTNAEKWCGQLLQLINASHGNMRLATTSSELNTWRKIYTDSCILRGISQFALSRDLEAIATLDHAIIIAGAQNRLDLILDVIRQLQTKFSREHRSNKHLSVSLRFTTITSKFPRNTVPQLPPPSFLGFQSKFSQRPFILHNFAADWPALQDRPWRSVQYLLSVAGPGRVVPVEVGADYRSKNWNQKIMQWESFLSTLDFEDQPAPKCGEEVLYLAQHDLTTQFPSLRDDIIIPDYVYASLACSAHPNYRPPLNDVNLLFNTWLGPKGTVSPAHTDPYFNFYVQVVGHKSVWLAPPSASTSMYPISSSLLSGSASGLDDKSAMINTSQIDVFSEPRNLTSFPDFVQDVVPVSMFAVLAPGDVLFFPPGWWHAMKSESTSFSFSIWF